MVNIEVLRKHLVFSIRFCWRTVCRHPFVAGLLLFMLFLYKYFPSTFFLLVYYSPVIVCTSLLLGALLVYSEPYIADPEVVKSVDASAEGEREISEENFKIRRSRNASKDTVFKQIHDRDDKGNTILAEKEIRNEETLSNEVEAHDLKFMELVFSVQNPAECSTPTAEGLKVEIKRPLDNQFESSLGSPWQQVNGHDVSSCSESDGESSSPDTSVADIVPIIDELNPLLESENMLQDHRSIDSSDAVSRASSPEHEFDDGSAEEETEKQADEEDEEAQEEKDNNESIVKWTADDEKNLMDLGSSEIERNRRLENLIAKRRARKLQRFQTDKNLIDLDAEPLPFMEEISRLNVQIPAISAPRCNPFDLPFDSEVTMGLPPIPSSAPSVLLPRRNPFDLPCDQDEESSKKAVEGSRTYDEPRIRPYFIVEKKIGTGFTAFEQQLGERNDSKESSDSESDSVSAVVNQDNELSESETHERVSSVSQDVEAVDQRSDLSVQVGSELEQNLADSEEQEIEGMDSSSPVSSSTNLEVIDERYDGSSSSSCSEENKCNEAMNRIEPSKIDLPVEGAESANGSQITEPVYDSSPSARSTVSHIPSLDDELFSKFKGNGGFTESSLASDMEANFLNDVPALKAVPEEADFILDEVNAELRGNKSIEVSNLDMNIVKNFHMEELMPEIKNQLSESTSIKELDSCMEDSCTEKRSTANQICLSNSHDQHSPMEQPRVLGSDSGASFDREFEMKNAGLHICEPSVDREEPGKKLNQETVASLTSGSTVDNSEGGPGYSSKSLNSKYQVDLLL